MLAWICFFDRNFVVEAESSGTRLGREEERNCTSVPPQPPPSTSPRDAIATAEKSLDTTPLCKVCPASPLAKPEAMGAGAGCPLPCDPRWSGSHSRSLPREAGTQSQRVCRCPSSRSFITIRREGLRDINALREAYRSRVDAIDKEAVAKGLPPSQQPGPTNQQIPFSPPPPPESESAPAQPAPETTAAPPGVKTLSSFLDLAKTRTLPPPQIEGVWRLRHAANPRSLSACFPAATYARMALAARRPPAVRAARAPRGPGRRDALPAVDLPGQGRGGGALHAAG